MKILRRDIRKVEFADDEGKVFVTAENGEIRINFATITSGEETEEVIQFLRRASHEIFGTLTEVAP